MNTTSNHLTSHIVWKSETSRILHLFWNKYPLHEYCTIYFTNRNYSFSFQLLIQFYGLLNKSFIISETKPSFHKVRLLTHLLNYCPHCPLDLSQNLLIGLSSTWFIFNQFDLFSWIQKLSNFLFFALLATSSFFLDFIGLFHTTLTLLYILGSNGKTLLIILRVIPLLSLKSCIIL